MSTAINLIDRNNESRKILWAVLASVLIHFVVAFSLATFGGKFSSLPEGDDNPAELTIVNVLATPPPVATNPPFMETDESKKSAAVPKEKTFESNANSIAASQLPGNGDNPLPSQEGKDRPFVNLETQQSSLALEGKQPQLTPAPSAVPTPQASEPPKSTPTPAPAATPQPEQFAMLTATPPPAIRAPEEVEASSTAEIPTPVPRVIPEQPASSYRAYKEQTHISGRITNRGASAVDAVSTPLGRYQKAITDAIGSRWLYYTKKQGDLITIGTAHVSFFIDREGHVQNLRMTGNSSNEAFANVCLGSIQEAKLPPAPPDVAEVLPPEGLIMDVHFTFFAN